MPVAVWVMKNSIDTVPYEIEEAARVEGCNSLTRANLIVISLIRPALASACVIAFFYGWNEFPFASVPTHARRKAVPRRPSWFPT
jgi:ABC-type glycerol-3-phosphate transport system permease component